MHLQGHSNRMVYKWQSAQQEAMDSNTYLMAINLVENNYLFNYTVIQTATILIAMETRKN